MSLLDKLERLLGRFAIPGITLYLIIGQVFVVLSTMAGLLNPLNLIFFPRLVLLGDWWRVATFILVPASVGQGLMGIVSLVFGWWIFYFMGSALEGYWGSFRYNLFLLVGYLLTVGLSFLSPDSPVTYTFLAGSIFLAFVYLNPDFELLIFFVLPVKVRWLGLIVWGFYAFQFVIGGASLRLQVAAAVGNLALFFGADAWRAAGRRTRQMAVETRRTPAAAAEPRHRCRICGKTDQTHPQLDFRYCSKCADDACYCPEHIFNHEHVRSADGTPPPA
jgi:hypothetical protein